jgi:DNA gyrase subunit A
MVHPEDEVYAITSAGGVIRTRAEEVKQSGRQTMGVRLMNLGSGNSVVALARNAESEAEAEAAAEAAAVDEPVDEAVDNDPESTDEDSGNEVGE